MMEPTDAMMLAADRAWRKELGGLYGANHSARAKAIRAIWAAMMAEASREEFNTAT